jgi:hypothetical protein
MELFFLQQSVLMVLQPNSYTEEILLQRLSFRRVQHSRYINTCRYFFPASSLRLKYVKNPKCLFTLKVLKKFHVKVPAS